MTAVVNAVIGQFWEIPIQWRIVLLLSLFTGVYAVFVKCANAKGCGASGQRQPDTSGMDGQQSARTLLIYLNEQANEAIVTLRDRQGTNVASLADFCNFAITVGRWSGRLEYLTGKLRNAFPNEVARFEVHGESDIQYQPDLDPIKDATRHLQAVLTVKVQHLRELTKAMQNSLSSNLHL